MAEKFDAVLSDYRLELRGDLLMVRHTHRIGASADADDLFRNGDFMLLDDLVVLYDVDCGPGGDKGYAVEFVIFEITVGDLDDAFAAEALAVQVAAYSDLVGRFCQMQDFHHLEKIFRRDVVKHGAVLDGVDYELSC